MHGITVILSSRKLFDAVLQKFGIPFLLVLFKYNVFIANERIEDGMLLLKSILQL